MVLIRLLASYGRPYRWAVAAVMAVQLIQTAAALSLPDLSADMIDRGVLPGDSAHIWRVGAVMSAVAVVQLVCGVSAAWIAARIASNLAGDLRAAQVEQVHSFSMRELHRFGAPSLITRATNDVQQLQMLVQTTLTFMVTAPLMCVGGIVFALNQDLPLSLLLVAVTPVLGVAIWVLLRGMIAPSRVLQDTIDTVNRILREQLTGQRVIRAFVTEYRERQRFAIANRRLTAVSERVGQLTAMIVPVVNMIAGVAGVPVLWFGAQRIEAGALGVGALTAFLGYLMQITGAATMSSHLFRQLPRAQVCAGRIKEVLDTESTVVAPATGLRVLPEPGRVELRGVVFHYPGAQEPVLGGVDLLAEPGSTVAIIGGTGSGKSTVLSLIPRLAEVSDGVLLLGGADIRTIDPAVIGRSIGYVPQRSYLFSGTVASNLRFGDPDASDAALWHALEVAQAKDFVAALPSGLDAPVAQGGANLSGGQRQRLAIARALVGRREVYLFDDSFSALDYTTDARLRAALARETVGATVIIVAQRVSTIRDADRIVVLEEGRVSGIGTHHELLDASATYREIVFSQMSEAEAAA